MPIGVVVNSPDTQITPREPLLDPSTFHFKRYNSFFPQHIALFSWLRDLINRSIETEVNECFNISYTGLGLAYKRSMDACLPWVIRWLWLYCKFRVKFKRSFVYRVVLSVAFLADFSCWGGLVLVVVRPYPSKLDNTQRFPSLRGRDNLLKCTILSIRQEYIFSDKTFSTIRIQIFCTQSLRLSLNFLQMPLATRKPRMAQSFTCCEPLYRTKIC